VWLTAKLVTPACCLCELWLLLSPCAYSKYTDFGDTVLVVKEFLVGILCCRPWQTWSNHISMQMSLAVAVCLTAAQCAIIQDVLIWKSSLQDHRQLLIVSSKMKRWIRSINEGRWLQSLSYIILYPYIPRVGRFYLLYSMVSCILYYVI